METEDGEPEKYVRVKADNSAQVTVNITINRFVIEWKSLMWLRAFLKDRKKMPSSLVGVFTFTLSAIAMVMLEL